MTVRPRRTATIETRSTEMFVVDLGCGMTLSLPTLEIAPGEMNLGDICWSEPLEFKLTAPLEPLDLGLFSKGHSK